MPITHDAETGWTFTHGQQRYTGYATREQACEALYDLGHSVVSPEQRIIDTIDQATQPGALVAATLAYIADDAAAAVFDYLSRRAAEGSKSARDLIDHALRIADNRLDAPAAVAIVRAHLDTIALTAEERAHVLAECGHAITDGSTTIHDWANRLSSPIEWQGVRVSPGALPDRASADACSHPPRLTMRDATLFLQGVGIEPQTMEDRIEQRIFNPWERVLEVVRLPHHKLVAVSTAEDLFILSEAEYAARV
jgi:hypothetical protein